MEKSKSSSLYFVHNSNPIFVAEKLENIGERFLRLDMLDDLTSKLRTDLIHALFVTFIAAVESSTLHEFAIDRLFE